MTKGNGRQQRRGTRGSCWKWSPVELGRGGLVGFAAETRRRWWLAVIEWRRKSRELVGAIGLAGIWIGRDPEGDMREVPAAAGTGMGQRGARV